MSEDFININEVSEFDIGEYSKILASLGIQDQDPIIDMPVDSGDNYEQLKVIKEPKVKRNLRQKYDYVDEEFPDATPEEKVLLRKLSLAQREFVLEYINCGNIKQAARKAGYSENFVIKKMDLLQQAPVRCYFKKIYEQIEKAKIMQAQEIQARLSDFARGDISDENIVVLKNLTGEEINIVDKKIPATLQFKALELLANMNGLIVNQHNVQIQVPRIVDDIK